MTRRPRGRHRRARPLFDDSRYVTTLACGSCVDFPTCGGLRLAGGLFGCEVTCCGNPASCQWTCRRASDFKSRVQEIGGFRFERLNISAQPFTGTLPPVVPLVHHGSSRIRPLNMPVVAIKLAALYERRTGVPRFSTRAQLCAAFKIAETTTIIASGIDDDPVVERWWEIGRGARRALIASLVDIGIGLVTTPNFSVCVDWPRTGDMASMMRIARCYEEFAEGGLPAALHVNGRTPRDFERWAELVRRTQGISHIAYEFSTGTAYADRLEQHVAWLRELAAAGGKTLGLVMTGESRAAHALANAFGTVTWIESTSFMRTMHRQAAARVGNNEIKWLLEPNAEGEDLAALYERNIGEVRDRHVLRGAM